MPQTFVAQQRTACIFPSMKRPFAALFVLLSSCSPSTHTDPLHVAVSQYVRATANDPASYEAVRWGKAVAYTRRDSVKA